MHELLYILLHFRSGLPVFMLFVLFFFYILWGKNVENVNVESLIIS